MTLESTVSAQTMLADGVVRQWPFTFRVWAGQVAVLAADPDGLEEDVTGQAQITIHPDGYGGVVTYPVAPEVPTLAAGWKLTVLRDMDFLQHTDLVTGSRYRSEVIEDRFDRLTAQDQELLEQLDRCIKVSVSSEEKPKTAEDIYDQVNRIADRADDAVDRAHEAVDRAASEADRAKAEADRAADMASVGAASKTNLGFVKIGDGISVDDGGTISVSRGMIDYSIPVTDASGSIPVLLSALGHPEQAALFNPWINLLSASPYFYGITRRNLEGFTVQIYRPDGTPGADIVEFVELGTFECGDGTECGQSGGGADVALLVSLPL